MLALTSTLALGAVLGFAVAFLTGESSAALIGAGVGGFLGRISKWWI